MLEFDSISHHHARIVQRFDRWYIMDLGSETGTLHNEEPVIGSHRLESGDRIKIGTTVLKILEGQDARVNGDVYRRTIFDGLTQAHNKRYLLEAIERAIMRARREDGTPALVMSISTILNELMMSLVTSPATSS